MTEQVVEWFAEVLRDPKYQVEEAAAELALEAAQLLRHAAGARQDIDQKNLAEILGVSPGRVSQVLNGDGNIHVGTLAKYMRALGYRVRLTPVSCDSAPDLKRDSRREASVEVYETVIGQASGVRTVLTAVENTESRTPVVLGETRHFATISLSSRRRDYVEDQEPQKRNGMHSEAVLAP